MAVEDDLNNLFAASEIGTLFLDTELDIKRFNPKAEELFHLDMERDLGRSIHDIASTLDYDTLGRDANEVLDTLIRKEIQIRNKDRTRLYLVRVVPYRNRHNVIEGVIITFLDITRFETLRLDLEESRTFFNNTLSAMREPLLLLRDDVTVFMANEAYYREFQTHPEATENHSFLGLEDRYRDMPELEKRLKEVVLQGTEIEALEMDHPRSGRHKIHLNARRIHAGETQPAMILISFHGIKAPQEATGTTLGKS